MSQRERFLSEMMENISLPYEVESKGYAEEIIGEFEYQAEKEYFQYIVDKTERKAVILDLVCGDGRHTLQFARSCRGRWSLNLRNAVPHTAESV